jgi:DNA-binding CsgD family transcriptional regulator
LAVIDEQDARAMVRILGETATCPGGHQEKKRLLMDLLADLIDADAWVWAFTRKLEQGEGQMHVSYMRNGFEDSEFASYLKAIEHPAIVEGSRKFFDTVVADLKHTTMTRDETDPEGSVYETEAQVYWEEAALGDVIMSSFPLDQRSLSSLGLYRRLGKKPFSEREKQIAHIVLSEVPWLHMSGWPEDRGVTIPQLYPRQRLALNLLLEGFGRKQISHHMEISEHTVSGYIKDLYKHFKVSSQPELMKKFLSGDQTS